MRPSGERVDVAREVIETEEIVLRREVAVTIQPVQAQVLHEELRVDASGDARVTERLAASIATRRNVSPEL